jgi:hypothetical protein
MNDELFRHKYMELYKVGIDNENERPYTDDDDVELSTDIDKYVYLFACVSHIDLIKRCLNISKSPLSFAINRAIDNRGQHGTQQMFINFDLESCKLNIRSRV